MAKPASAGHHRPSITPRACRAWQAISRCSRFHCAGMRTVINAPTATLMPKRGQNRSSQTEPGSTCRAITGRKVAVMM